MVSDAISESPVANSASARWASQVPAESGWNTYDSRVSERVEHLPAEFRARAAVAEAEQEMRLFERFSHHYGYTFYILHPDAAARPAPAQSIRS